MYKNSKKLVMICLIELLFSCGSEKKNENPPNIIIIFADDMGYGDLSSYGHPNIKTARLDKMANEGIRFTSFYAAASVCSPSRAALLTGRHPIRHTPNNFGPDSKNGLPVNETSIAQILKNKGYNTMAIGKWHLGHHPEFLPTSRGFDSFYGLPYSNDMILPWCPWLNEDDKLFIYEDSKAIEEIGFDQENLTINYTNKATEFISNHQDKPFFLYLAHSMPHLPISTSEEFIGKSKGGLYGDVIETIDWSMGEIFQTLKETALDDNTIVIFTSDNGPWQNLPDRMLQNGVEETHAGSSGLLKGSKNTSYEGGFRVPAIIRWTKRIPEGIVSRELATTMDLFPTLIRLAGAEIPNDRVIDGRNIYSLLIGENIPSSDPFFYCRGVNLEAVRKGKWKLRHTKDTGFELYDLNIDPSEMYNLKESNQEVVLEMYKEMERFSKETGAKLLFMEE